MSDANQDMPEQTVAGILIVGLDLKGFQKIPDIPDDCICLLILEQTLVNRDDIVRSLLINAGDDLSVPLVRKDCMHLIAIMQRRFHTCDLVYRTVWLHENRYLLLLLFQLLLIGQMKQLAATAFFLHTAYLSGICFFFGTAVTGSSLPASFLPGLISFLFLVADLLSLFFSFPAFWLIRPFRFSPANALPDGLFFLSLQPFVYQNETILFSDSFFPACI